jgi:hypothetical protein
VVARIRGCRVGRGRDDRIGEEGGESGACGGARAREPGAEVFYANAFSPGLVVLGSGRAGPGAKVLHANAFSTGLVGSGLVA